MKKYSQLRPFILFNTLGIMLFVVLILLYIEFKATKKSIEDTNFYGQITYTKSITDNIKNLVMQETHHQGICMALQKDKKLQKEVNKYLSILITQRYRYAYIVTKREKNRFVFLADGSRSIEDKAEFEEGFEPLEPKLFLKVYKTKEATYFKHKDNSGLWVTYLNPIIQDNHVVALLVVDFSLSDFNILKSSLNNFNDIYKKILFFFLLILLIIVLFSYFDFKRGKELQRLNNELFELNLSLETRIEKEVLKNQKKERQLLQQSKLAQMGEMMSMIAHQWRQPLTAISAASNTIFFKAQLQQLDNKEAEELSFKVSEYATHLSKTINDFRDFFKEDKERIETSLQEIVQSSLDIVSDSIKNKNIEIKVDFQSKKKFYTYPNELKQVVLNLLKNAEEILLERQTIAPCIEIKVYDLKNEIILDVKDNAGGISKEIRNKIFEPYFSTKKKKDGTGLGLYMSKTIVEEHCGGVLEVSNWEKGALFRVKLQEESLNE